MEWFNGDIAAAIQQAKTSQSTLIVYLFGSFHGTISTRTNIMTLPGYYFLLEVSPPCVRVMLHVGAMEQYLVAETDLNVPETRLDDATLLSSRVSLKFCVFLIVFPSYR
jgi:hypothetical protein